MIYKAHGLSNRNPIVSTDHVNQGLSNMFSQSLRVVANLFLGSLLGLVAGCAPVQLPTLAAVPLDVEVTGISEKNAITREIIQTKTFNQCESASAFKAQVQFSDSSNQSSQQELVLKVAASGEVGLSPVAKAKLEGAIEQHFSSSSALGQTHGEGVSLEIPAYTQQEYSITWRETRREGTVEYVENGDAKSSDFSYRVGLELVSARGRDLPCPGQQSSQSTASQPPTQPTPVRSTATPVPQQPTPLPPPTAVSDTPAGTLLGVGEAWRQGGVNLSLVEINFNPYYNPSDDAVDCNFAVAFNMQNLTASSFIVNVQLYQFSAVDNLGNRWTPKGISGGHPCPGSRDRDETVYGQMSPQGRFPVDTGYDIWNVGFEGGITDRAVDYVTVTVTDLLSFSKAQWRIPINN